MLIRCLLCVPVGDDGCLTDGHVILWCLDAVVADVDCVVKADDDCEVDGRAILNVADGVFDVNVNLDLEVC